MTAVERGLRGGEAGLGINGAELLVLLLVFLVVLGPKGLHQALTGFKKLVTWVRSQSQRLREESKLDLSSAGLDGFDWSEFDLSEYDPREIIRQAVKEEMDAWIDQAKGVGTPSLTIKPPGTSGSMQTQQDDTQEPTQGDRSPTP